MRRENIQNKLSIMHREWGMLQAHLSRKSSHPGYDARGD